MSGIRLQNIEMLHLLWTIPFLCALLVYAWQKRRKALEMFIEAGLLDRIHISADHSRRILKAILLLMAVMLLTFSMTRPSGLFFFIPTYGMTIDLRPLAKVKPARGLTCI